MQPSTFKVYNASAGSGKTFTLVKSYLKILLATEDVYRFQNILAVTFTNKAAAEMKTRVIESLREFSEPAILQHKTELFKAIEEDFLNEGMLANDEIIHQRSKKIVNAVLQNYSAFNITTIDSFTHRLIRSFAYDLGLSLNFDVEMDANSLLDEAVDQLISQIGEDAELTNILIDFSLQKTDDDKSWDISRELKEIAKILLNENDKIQLEKIQGKPIKDFIDLKNQLLKEQKNLEKEFAILGEEGLQLIDGLGLIHKDFYYSQFPKHFQNLIENTGKLSFDSKSGLGKSIENNLFYTKGKSDDIKSKIDGITPQLLVLYSDSQKVYQKYILHQLFLSNLIPLAVLSRISKTLNEIKEEKNIRLNAEFNQLISKNLQDQPAPYIYERIGEKFKHYFIDEMQDTSLLQWHNIIPLIQNALSQEQTGLLLVGDTKQSIYRWRGSEPEQFLKLAQEGDTYAHNPFHIEKKLLSLDTNYRSYTEVIDFNNNFFQYLSNHFNETDYANIYFNENHQQKTNKKGGYVEISFLEKGLVADEKDMAYAEKVLQIIQNCSENFQLNEICILTRTRKQGVTLANFLTENNIDIISSETLLLQNSEKVNFVIDVLTYLQNNNDKEAKFNLLYFLYDHLKISGDKHLFFKKLIDLSVEELFVFLKDYQINFNPNEIAKLPLYESIEYIIRSVYFNKTSDAYLQFFLDEVLKFSLKKSTDTWAFLEFWKEKKDKLSIVVPEEKNAVQIMTIHKSKGLEFPVVIFPYDLDIYKDMGSKGWYPIENPTDFNNFETLLVNHNKSLEQVGDLGEYLYQAYRDQKELDNINLLYVTFTRAIEQLYILAEHKNLKDNPNTSSQFLIDFFDKKGEWNDTKSEYTFGNIERISIKPKAIKDTVQFNQIISTSWQSHNINIVTNSSLLWDNERGESIKYGNLIHELMALIKTADDVEEAIEKYIALGNIVLSEKGLISELIHQIVSHPSLKNYYQQNNKVYSEREIFTELGEIIIPDRLVIDEQNNAVIIDYKTGKPDKKYHHQLNSYAVAVSQIGYKVDKKILVYIEDDVLVEEVK
ncbi:UvrD-helicase domain-containing protein [Aureibaculum sp. 2210JD6-5]|uniref:UvrD-helicase domain-containing protein n=1 Tax=Aureibaculum sp. 2210JD6-5 TaxID=3103957 RepID=UPI002AACBA0C|nr:UvrD-helicase domain-containing protein [Aureibaculum sp. 2210JD6-5]MDY7395943.1 UvrD-helicase domain-containing protein [Aureibaculum sp. 2210JD6-5]